MRSNFFYYAYIIIVVFFILAIAELISWNILKEQHHNFSLFYRNKDKTEFEDYKSSFNFYKLDPLLGWTHTLTNGEDSAKIILESNIIYEDTFKIFITGGSTSDMVLFDYNWPKGLMERFKNDSINTIIYCGGIGGYGSSQEFLKVIQEFPLDKMDLLISYSGANENYSPNYVTEHEKDIYRFYSNYINTSLFLPNLVFILKIKIFKFKPILINNVPSSKSANQWIKNMRFMHSLSKEFDFKFMGILQPVYGAENQKLKYKNENINKNRAKGYSIFYPEAISKAKKYNYIYDFTNIFNNTIENPYIDDCHVKGKYQYIIADSIYCLIKENFIASKKVRKTVLNLPPDALP